MSASHPTSIPGAKLLIDNYNSFPILLFLFLFLPDQTELLTQLNALPVRVDTLRVKTTKAELERKLSEIESAIKIFSRPKVFVKVDE